MATTNTQETSDFTDKLGDIFHHVLIIPFLRFNMLFTKWVYSLIKATKNIRVKTTVNTYTSSFFGPTN